MALELELLPGETLHVSDRTFRSMVDVYERSLVQLRERDPNADMGKVIQMKGVQSYKDFYGQRVATLRLGLGWSESESLAQIWKEYLQFVEHCVREGDTGAIEPYNRLVELRTELERFFPVDLDQVFMTPQVMLDLAASGVLLDADLAFLQVVSGYLHDEQEATVSHLPGDAVHAQALAKEIYDIPDEGVFMVRHMRSILQGILIPQQTGPSLRSLAEVRQEEPSLMQQIAVLVFHWLDDEDIPTTDVTRGIQYFVNALEDRVEASRTVDPDAPWNRYGQELEERGIAS